MNSRHLPAVGRSLAMDLWWGPALALALVGCTPSDEVTKYDAPRNEPPARAFDADRVRGQLDHMFAAVVPAGQKAWFFKLVAPADAAEELREPFREFVASVDVREADDLPAWKLAEGWTQRAGSGLRAATIEIPRGDAKLELTVSSLPLGNDWDDFLEQNVTRWLGQLQEQPLPLSTIKRLAKSVDAQGGAATVFELIGQMRADAMMAGAAVPEGHPPASAGATSQAAPRPAATNAATGELAFDAPDGWQPKPLGMMRKASFAVTGDGGQADVSVTIFPAVQDMADPRANAVRWAGQAGIQNLTDADLKKAGGDIRIGGLEATRFEFLAPADPPGGQGVIAAMAIDGDEVWFFKISGDRDVVEQQREAFDAWLASIRFPTNS